MAGPVVGKPFTTSVGEVYLAIPKHRGNANSQRSVWTKPVSTEIACFVHAWTASWGSGGEFWGHHQGAKGLEPLGRNGFQENLWFGKFIRASGALPWHGYPADYRRNAQDRPPVSILVQWRTLGVIAKHQAAKIAGGQPCRL